MAHDLINRLRASWDQDRSIISQTDIWMKERREAADEIERLRAGLEEIVAFAPDEKTARHASNVLRGIESKEAK